MRQETITYQAHDEEGISGEVILTLTRANVAIGMQRSIYQVEAAEENRDEESLALRVLRSVTYPDLVSPVLSAIGKLEIDGEVVDFASHWPLRFQEFLLLPDDLVSRWEGAVYRLNPHWNPAGEPKEEAEKKAGT